MLSLRLSVLLVLAASVGCSANTATGTSTTTTSSSSSSSGGEGGSGGGIGATTTSGDPGVGGGDFTTGAGGGTGGGEPMIAEVWGQSPDKLYKLDPNTNAVTTIGPFDGCGSVIDIALDKDSNLYASGSGGLFLVDKTSAHCTLIATGSYPNSLSFVPAGTVDPDKEALVGYLGAQYIRIDPKSGQVTPIGQLTGGYSSSGDVVSVKDGKTFLTANGPDCFGGDCLLEINPTTGDLVKNWGSVGFSAVYGLAFWAGKAYGFTDGGALFEISFTASAISSKQIMIPGAPQLQFWGAGSTTSAPVKPVPK